MSPELLNGHPSPFEARTYPTPAGGPVDTPRNLDSHGPLRMIVTVTVAALIVAGCGGGHDDSETAAEAPVSARATYTGGACEYDGPEEVAVGVTLSVTVVNTTTQPEVGFALWKVPDGTTAEAITDQDIGEIVARDDQARDVVFTPTEAGWRARSAVRSQHPSSPRWRCVRRLPHS